MIDALAPGKDVKRQCPLSTHRVDLWCGAAVHVDLSVERRQWREVVATVRIRRDPGQTVAAVNAAGPALAHGAATIVHRRLRHRAKRKTPPAGNTSARNLASTCAGVNGLSVSIHQFRSSTNVLAMCRARSCGVTPP